MSTIYDFQYHVDKPNPQIGVAGLFPSTSQYPSTGLYPNEPTSNSYILTAIVNDDSSPIIEYRWDVGDGLYRYGQSITYTYPVSKAEKFVYLRVTDKFGKQGHCFTCLG